MNNPMSKSVFINCEAINYEVTGFYIGTGADVEFHGKTVASGHGLLGVHVRPNATLEVNGTLEVSNNSLHGILVERSIHPLKETITRMNALLRLPGLKPLRDGLLPMLNEINHELEQLRPNKFAIRSVLLAVKSFLARAAQQVVRDANFTALHSAAQRGCMLAWQG
jgi:hypothetical protein